MSLKLVWVTQLEPVSKHQTQQDSLGYTTAFQARHSVSMSQNNINKRTNQPRNPTQPNQNNANKETVLRFWEVNQLFPFTVDKLPFCSHLVLRHTVNPNCRSITQILVLKTKVSHLTSRNSSSWKRNTLKQEQFWNQQLSSSTGMCSIPLDSNSLFKF